jgi:hypothetical protein
MDSSAGRLQDLIRDIANFSALINNEEIASALDLNEVLEKVLTELNLFKSADIQVYRDHFSVIAGYPRELHVLFTACLIML